MVQNRNKLLDLFLGNASNAILHRLLEKAILELNNSEVAGRYRKEMLTSFEVAKKYREKINPQKPPFPQKDILNIKERLRKNIRNEISIIISRGYKNLNLDSIEGEIDSFLVELKIAE